MPPPTHPSIEEARVHADQLAAGRVVDRYTVEGRLGAGAMAVVYRVRHNQLGTLHALKVLSVSSTAIRERLLQEGRVQASLQHPNVVRVHDVVTVDGAPGLLMELVRGPSLDRLLQDNRLTLDQADVLARGVVRGVAAAHALGLVHRDLKPANIMLSLEAEGLVPKVGDFGLAKLFGGDGGATATRTGTTMGTPAYMAPEQIRDAKSVDARADVFALGAILYELVCGRRAFPGGDLIDLFNRIGRGEYTPPRDLVPDLPRRMERAIVGALAPDREDRIADCEALSAVWAGRVDVDAEGRGSPWTASLVERYAGPEEGEPEVPSGAAETLDLEQDLPPVLSLDGLTVSLPEEEAPPEGQGAAPIAVPPPAARRWRLAGLAAVPLLALGVATVSGGGIPVLWDAEMAPDPGDAAGAAAALAVDTDVGPAPLLDPVRLHPPLHEVWSLAAKTPELTPLVEAYGALLVWPLPAEEEDAVQWLLDWAPPRLEAIEAQGTEIASTGDAEVAAGALFVIAASLLYYADAGLAIRPPDRYSAEEQQQYRAVLEQEIFPKFYMAHDKAHRRLAALVDHAPAGPWRQAAVDLLDAIWAARESDLAAYRPHWAMIASVMDREIPRLEEVCRPAGGERRPDGAWTVDFWVEKEGDVTDVTVEPEGAPDPDFEVCAARVVAGWRFEPVRWRLPARRTLIFQGE